MIISGVQKFTTLDYRDKTACIVFTPGCNFRCGYCHNPEFVLPEEIAKIKHSFIPEEVFFKFLDTRKGLLDAVVISGGEPTLMPDLIDFMRKVKSPETRDPYTETRISNSSFLVKLDTNGSNPEVLQEAVESGLVDYVAMDVKTGLSKYKDLVGPGVDPEKIKESIEFLKENKVEYEFRTTLVKEIHSKEALAEMKEMLYNAKKLYLQTFRPSTTLDPKFEQFHAFSGEEMGEIAGMFEGVAGKVVVR